MQIFTGKVISNKMNNTLVVVIESVRAHPKYRKLIKKSTKVKAHNLLGEVEVGQLVKIESCRPISKDKHFVVKEIIGSRLTKEISSEEIKQEVTKVSPTKIKKSLKKTKI